MAKKHLRISPQGPNDVVVGSVVSRLLLTLDRIPGWLAFLSIAIVGGLESFLLFRAKSESDEIVPRSAPYVALAAAIVVAMILVRSSRPVVVRRETGSRGNRLLSLLKSIGQVTILSAVIGIFLVLPAILLIGKTIDTLGTRSDKPATSPSVPTSFPSAVFAALPPVVSVANSVPAPAPSSAPSRSPIASAAPRPVVAPSQTPQPRIVPTSTTGPTVRPTGRARIPDKLRDDKPLPSPR